MAIPDISLAQFSRIAVGSCNSGQIDIKANEGGGAEPVKINNHVWRTVKTSVELSPERVIETREAFLGAFQKGGAGADAAKARFTPLARAQVRSILADFGATDDKAGGTSYQIDIGV